MLCSASSSARTAQPQVHQTSLASRVLGAGVAVGLSLGMAISCSPALAAEPSSLADLTRPQFEFVDADKDGVISREEIQQTSKEVAAEVDFMLPDQPQLDFAMKLFDLDANGTLTAEELYTSLALDGAVSEDALDEGVWKVFDRNSDGKVDMREWKAGLPALGPGGDAAKEYVFTRVDGLVDGNAKLDQQEFANALTMTRVMVMGY